MPVLILLLKNVEFPPKDESAFEDLLYDDRGVCLTAFCLDLALSFSICYLKEATNEEGLEDILF